MDSLTSPDDSPSASSGGAATGGLDSTVDWVVTALLVLAGLLGVALGALLFSAADRAALAQAVAEGTIESDVLSNAELVDVSYALTWWGGIGVAVTGVLLVVAGVAFVAYRRRSRNAADDATIDSGLNAVVGAMVTAVASFLPISPLFGGAVAGYLSRDRGLRVGGLSGVLAAVPLLAVFAFLGVGLATAGFGVVAAVLVLATLLGVAFTVVLSAVGGYLGVALADRRETA